MRENVCVPKRMTAIVLHGPNDYEIEEVDVPKPGYQEVLCRVKAIAICGTDPHLIAGEYPGFWPPGYPFIAGHEWSGEIVAVGTGVVGFKVGDRICVESAKGCGVCDRCLEGRYNICANYGKGETGHRQYGLTENGGYAEYCVVSIKTLHHLPSTISFEEGALIDTAAIGLHAVDRGPVMPGDNLAIVGPGAVGLLALQSAKAAGASNIVLIGYGEGDEMRLELGRKLGANETIDSKVVDPIERVRDLTSGRGADIAIECSGSVGGYKTILDLVRQGARVVFVGLTAGKEIPIATDKIVLNELDVHGVRANPNACERVIRLVANGKIQLKPLITHEYPLIDFSKALEVFTKHLEGAIKVIIRP